MRRSLTFVIPIIIIIVIFGFIFMMKYQGVSLHFASPSISPTGVSLSEITPIAPNQAKPNTMTDQQAPQQQQQPSQMPQGPEKPIEQASVSATIKTSKGNIVLLLATKEAPKTVANFVQKAKSGFYNNLTFHRVEDWVIQGGDPKGNGTGGGQMPTELNQLPFSTGALGVARGGDINVSNDSQFFITKSDATWLNGQYTNFGQVISGMDVVNKIAIGDKILSITTN